MNLFRKVALAVLLFIPGMRVLAQPVRQVAVTLDDLPYAFGDAVPLAQQEKDFRRILEVLDQFGVKCTGFVIGGKVTAQNRAWLEEWVKRGHQLGNHTFSHPDLNTTPASTYIRTIAQADQVLRPWLGKTKYFRYPYLRQGNTPAKRDSVANYLQQAGYQLAPVTIDNDEWIYNRDFVRVQTSGLTNQKQADRIGEAYLEHLRERTNYFEQLATTKLHRPVKHILLLHLNAINARYLAELLNEYQQQGWQFIPLADALKDPLYQLSDSYLGDPGISVLERIKP